MKIILIILFIVIFVLVLMMILNYFKKDKFSLIRNGKGTGIGFSEANILTTGTRDDAETGISLDVPNELNTGVPDEDIYRSPRYAVPDAVRLGKCINDIYRNNVDPLLFPDYIYNATNYDYINSDPLATTYVDLLAEKRNISSESDPEYNCSFQFVLVFSSIMPYTDKQKQLIKGFYDFMNDNEYLYGKFFIVDTKKKYQDCLNYRPLLILTAMNRRDKIFSEKQYESNYDGIVRFVNDHQPGGGGKVCLKQN